MENFNRIENTIILFAQAAEYTVAGLDKEDVITEENGGMRAYPLFPFGQVRNVEAFYIEFDAGVGHDSLPPCSRRGGICLSGAGNAYNGGRRKRSLPAGKTVHTAWGRYFPCISQCFR